MRTSPSKGWSSARHTSSAAALSGEFTADAWHRMRTDAVLPSSRSVASSPPFRRANSPLAPCGADRATSATSAATPHARLTPPHRFERCVRKTHPDATHAAPKPSLAPPSSGILGTSCGAAARSPPCSEGAFSLWKRTRLGISFLSEFQVANKTPQQCFSPRKKTRQLKCRGLYV